MPLVIAHGAGALGNRSIGTAAAGGMLVGTTFGLLLVPGLYVIFAGMIPKDKKDEEEPATEAVEEEAEEPAHA
jgi:HAE1 family hydrophobic/amphiphilic exporter-1